MHQRIQANHCGYITVDGLPSRHPVITCKHRVVVVAQHGVAVLRVFISQLLSEPTGPELLF